MGVVNTFVNSDVVGEETQLEVGEGISPSQEEKSLERAMGFEPTTSCLGSKHSTPELRPLGASDCTILEAKDGWLDTVQYALHAGGQGFDSPHLHQQLSRLKRPSIVAVFSFGC